MKNKNHFKVKQNCKRRNCKDVFNAFLVEKANFDGIYDIPIIHYEDSKPNKLIRFSKCIGNKDYSCWIHFYEDDYLFERLWNNPKKYLNIIKKYNGVILPDFSLYRDMPLCMQIWNIYKSRAIGHWLQIEGVRVIPNIRFGDERTFNISCNGIEKNSTIAIGTYGSYKNFIDRTIIIKGILYTIDLIKPKRIVIYGIVPQFVKHVCSNNDIELISFNCDFSWRNK